MSVAAEGLRDRLLTAAGELLLESGDPQALSVRAVTRRAGVSPTALYLHFPDVASLVAAVLEDGFREFRQRIADASDEHPGGPRAGMRAAAEAYLRFGAERPGVYRLIFDTKRPEKGAGEAAPEGQAAFAALVEGVQECRPDLAEQEAWARAGAIWASLHGHVMLADRFPGREWPDLAARASAAVDPALDAP